MGIAVCFACQVDKNRKEEDGRIHGRLKVKYVGTIVLVCLALSLAACGGSHLSVDLAGGGETLRLDFRPRQAVEHRLPLRISGGIPPYESSIEGCPDWVTLLPDQGVLAGMAPAEDGGKTYFCTYRVTESDPGFRSARTVSHGLRLVVSPDTPPPLTLPRLSKVNLSVGTFRGEALPVATGGVQPYTYSFTCTGGSLPSGMGFAPATRRFAGTPDARFRDSCTYSVTDSSQPAETVSVAVEVEVTDDVPPLTLPRLSKVNLSVGTFHDEALAVATGGVQPYTYSFTCTGGSLPSGMGFAPATRRFAGTPDARFRDSCTYSVTDSSQPAETVSVAVEVEVTGAATRPLTLPRLSKVNLSVGTFHDEALAVATGGVQPYTYSFTCTGGSLPSGMGFAPVTRRFAGTPDARFRDSCTYSVTDSSQPAAMVSVAVEVEVTGAATRPLTLPRPSKVTPLGGDVPRRGAIRSRPAAFSPTRTPSPAPEGRCPRARALLPRRAGSPERRTPGSATRARTRSPTALSPPRWSRERSRSMWRVVCGRWRFRGARARWTSRWGRSTTRSFRSRPAASSPTRTPSPAPEGRCPRARALLPRRAAGTPDARFRDSCTYSVTDSSEPAAMVSRAVEVDVAGGVRPLALPRLAKMDLSVGTFHDEELPVATGGVQPYTYTFACTGGALPSGTGFAPETRRFAGTPDARFRDSCTYSVTDSSEPAAMVSRAVEVDVAGGVRPLALPRLAKMDLSVGTFHDEELPVATGGVQPYTYTFACTGGALPSGTGFAPVTRRFAGTPEAPVPRLVHVLGHRQLSARRDGLASGRGRSHGRGNTVGTHPGIRNGTWQ